MSNSNRSMAVLVGVLVPIGVLLLVGAFVLVFVLLRRRKEKKYSFFVDDSRTAGERILTSSWHTADSETESTLTSTTRGSIINNNNSPNAVRLHDMRDGGPKFSSVPLSSAGGAAATTITSARIPSNAGSTARPIARKPIGESTDEEDQEENAADEVSSDAVSGYSLSEETHTNDSSSKSE